MTDSNSSRPKPGAMQDPMPRRRPSSPIPDPDDCPECEGRGTKVVFDPTLIVPDEHLSLRECAIEPWQRKFDRQYYIQTLDSLAHHFHISVDTPWRDLDEKVRREILYGTGNAPVAFRFNDGDKSYSVRRPFEGVVPIMERRWRETRSVDERNELLRYHSTLPCKTCQGREIKADAAVLSVSGKKLYGAALTAYREKCERDRQIQLRRERLPPWLRRLEDWARNRTGHKRRVKWFAEGTFSAVLLEFAMAAVALIIFVLFVNFIFSVLAGLAALANPERRK